MESIPRVVVVYVYSGTPRRGWCDRCFTSARLEVDLLTISAAGVSVIGKIGDCTRCDKDRFAGG